MVVVVDPRKIKIEEPSMRTKSTALAAPRNRATPARAKTKANPSGTTPARDDVIVTIRHLGRTLDDLERLRIMNGNRVAAAKRDGTDLPWMDVIDQQLRATEHAAELELRRAWRKHPLAQWAKAIPGAGEILMARLIAEIDGDRVDKRTGEIRPGPLHAPNPGKLLAFCGHGDPARAGKMQKGATQAELFKRGSPTAKKATWKLAYQFMRTVGSDATELPISTGSSRRSPRSPYRDVYEQRKEQTQGRLHEKTCVRCGPAGKPAPAGSPWSDAHRHGDALRIVGKRFLVDLWVASRQSSIEPHRSHAGGES